LGLAQPEETRPEYGHGPLNPREDRPLSSEQIQEEILEAREVLGLAQPEETVPEYGHGPLNPLEDRPLSSEHVQEEILEARENLGLKKPFETIPERGKADFGEIGLSEGQNKGLPA
jgi:hypothetical protein